MTNNPLDPKYDTMAILSNKKAAAMLNELVKIGRITSWGVVEGSDESVRFNCYDGWITVPSGDTYLFETKNVNYAHDRFPNGWMLEVKKRDELMKEVDRLEVKGAVYINTFSDNKASMWIVNNTYKLPIATINAPSYTATGGSRIDKKVVYLKIENSIQVNLNTDEPTP